MLRKRDEIELITETVALCDMVRALSKAALEFSFGYILEGDFIRTQKELRKLFEKRTVCRK